MSGSESDIFKKYEYITEHPKEYDLIHRPIAVFDSGVGGISVLREMVKLMPNENFLYYGDSANAPYGTKEMEVVRNLTISHVEDFMMRPVKACAIACNSATSAAVRKLREMYPMLPLVGIEPALKPAALHKRNARVLVLATPMTISQEKFQRLLEKYDDKATVYSLPCPGLMEYVESGMSDSKEVRNFLEKLLSPYRRGVIDAVVLGCTHYPFVEDAIRQVVGPGVEVFDGGAGTAREMRRRIEQAGLLTDSLEPGKVVFENSRMTEEKLKLCEDLLNS